MPTSRSNPVQLAQVRSWSGDDCRLLVESVADYAIYMLDPEGRVATWNVGAEKIKGYNPRHRRAARPTDPHETGPSLAVT